MGPKPPTRVTRSISPSAKVATQVPRAVSALARSDPAGVAIAAHHHERDQFIYAIHGVMTVRTSDAIWTIPPSHGIWMPAFVEHAITMDVAVEMRTLYFQRGTVRRFGADCKVLAVTPLLRELILRAMAIPPRYAVDGPDGRLMQLVVDDMGVLEQQPLSLKLPTDKRLARLCQLLLDHPGDSASIAELGQQVGLSERSVIRLFPQETGLSLHRWRQQARLMRAFALSESGLGVGQIAFELGYSSGSAFSKMFVKQFGQSPRAVLKGG
jgi:AraC-like DNA-binding protein